MTCKNFLAPSKDYETSGHAFAKEGKRRRDMNEKKARISAGFFCLVPAPRIERGTY
jgi:hypothetical protein